MSPRRRPPPPAGRGRRGPHGQVAGARPAPSLERREEWAGVEWVVRAVAGSASGKAYRCPGCEHVVAAATPHVVVWPLPGSTWSAPGGVAERRHWHRGCWQARDRRRPR